MDREQAKMIASFEQGAAMMEQFAYLLWQYFERLSEKGFTPNQALTLCRAYQTTVLKSAFNNPSSQKTENENDD
jgi:hypothetical protein